MGFNSVFKGLITLSSYSVIVIKEINKKHKSVVPRTVAMMFLPKNVTTNSFSGQGNVCFHIFALFILSFRCRVINPCLIPCNNELQILLSLVSLTWQRHDRPNSTTLWSAVSLSLNSRTFLCNPTLRWQWQAHYPVKCLAVGHYQLPQCFCHLCPDNKHNTCRGPQWTY